jgi:transposase
MQVQSIPTNADTTINFLNSLHTEFDGNVLLIWDGLPAHRSKLVTGHIERQTWLTVARLPAYAPELNPVEYLWSAMKTKHTSNVADDTISALTDRIERAYNHYSAEAKTLRGFLKASSLYEGI